MYEGFESRNLNLRRPKEAKNPLAIPSSSASIAPKSKHNPGIRGSSVSLCLF